MKSQTILVAVIGLAAVALPWNPVAAEAKYTVRLGGAYNDNVRRETVDTQDSTVGIAGLALSTSHEWRRLTANLVADVEHRVYSEETAEDETLGAGNADALLAISPGFFDWFAQYEFGTMQTDPFGANEPGNRGNTSTFATGPNFHLELGAITAIELQGRHMQSAYEANDVDSTSLQGNMSLIRSLSDHRFLSLNATADRTEYDAPTQETKFDRQSAFVRLDSTSSRGNISISAGYNEIHDGGEVLDGMLLNLSFSRELTRRAMFALEYDQRFDDAGELFRMFADSAGNSSSVAGGLVDSTDVANPVENRRLSATITLRGRVTNYDVGIIADELDFESAETRNRRHVQLRAGLSREFGSAWQAELGAQLGRTKFDTSEREDDDIYVTAGLSRRLTAMLGLRFEYAHARRNSDDALAEYDQNEYSLLFTYGNQ